METNLKPWCLAFPKLQEGTEASGLSGYVIRTTSMGRMNPERWWQQVTSHNHWHNPLARAFISWLSAAWLSTHRSQIHQTKQGCAEGKRFSSFSDPLLPTFTSEMHQRFWRDLPGKRFPTSYFITKQQQKLNEVVFNMAVMYKLTVHNGWHSDFPLIHEIPNFYPFSKPLLLFLNPKFSIIICPVARANDVWHILHSCHATLTINVLIPLGQASLYFLLGK